MNNVLFATDGSIYSQQAAKFLASLPHRQQLHVDVLSIVNAPPTKADRPQAQWYIDYVQNLHHQAEKDFAVVKSELEGKDAVLQHQIRSGRVGATIVEAAKELAADVVVLGARGRSEIERVLLGSTSDYVATHSHCSVLVVRPTSSGNQQAFHHDRPKFVLAYEDAGPSQAALEEIMESNWAIDASVNLVAVLPALPQIGDGVDIEHHAKSNTERAIGRAEAAFRGRCQSVNAKIVDLPHVGEGLVNFAEDNQCDMIVVGESSRTSLGRVLLGSVSRYVLRHAPCSVLITRNRMIKGTVE